MKPKIKSIYLLLIGVLLTILIDLTFIARTDLLPLIVTTLLFMITGLFIKNFKTSNLIKYILLLLPVFLFSLWAIIVNPLLFPNLVPTIFILSFLSLIGGSILSSKFLSIYKK